MARRGPKVKPNSKRVVIATRVSESVAQQIAAFCDRQGMEVSDFTREAIERQLNSFPGYLEKIGA